MKKRRIVFSLVISALIAVSVLTFPVLAVNNNNIEPLVSVIPCPNCEDGNLANLGHKVTTWDGTPTRNAFDHPLDIDPNHTHSFCKCYYMQRCYSCGYTN